MVHHNGSPLPGKGKSSHRQPVSNKAGVALFHFIYKNRLSARSLLTPCSRIRYRVPPLPPRSRLQRGKKPEGWASKFAGPFHCREISWHEALLQGHGPEPPVVFPDGQSQTQTGNSTHTTLQERTTTKKVGYKPNSRKAYGLEARPMQVVS